jgi:hypothetical protein
MIAGDDLAESGGERWSVANQWHLFERSWPHYCIIHLLAQKIICGHFLLFLEKSISIY